MITFAIGNKVVVDHPSYPGVWTVRKVNPANLRLDQEGRRGLNAPKTMCRLQTDAEQAAPATIGAPLSRPEGLRTSAVVHFKAGGYAPRGITPGQLLVVIRDDYSTVNVTVLGGDPDRRYWRKIAPAWLEVIDPSAIEVRESVSA